MKHPVEGKVRTRKPETVRLHLVREVNRAARNAVFGDVNHFSRMVHCIGNAQTLLAELRRSLRDTRGAK